MRTPERSLSHHARRRVAGLLPLFAVSSALLAGAGTAPLRPAEAQGLRTEASPTAIAGRRPLVPALARAATYKARAAASGEVRAADAGRADTGARNGGRVG